MTETARTNAIWVSADALSGCVDVARDAGFDVRPYLARHGIDPELIEHARGLLSYQAISACLEDIAQLVPCPDFGFQLGRHQKPLQFGMISQLLQFAPTVGEAIRVFLRYRDLYSQSAHWDLSVEDDIAHLKRRDFGLSARRNPQIVVLAVTRGLEAMRALIGADWVPIGVYFSTDHLTYQAAMRRYAGAPIFFKSECDAIAFDAACLEQPIPTGNADILSALTRHFDRLFPDMGFNGPVSAQVQKQLQIGIEAGACRLASIAAHFRMHPRALQRALAHEGTSFRVLEQRTRLLLARPLVEGSRAQLSDVAVVAGYRHLSSFSRAYKRQQGGSPRRPEMLDQLKPMMGEWLQPAGACGGVTRRVESV